MGHYQGCSYYLQNGVILRPKDEVSRRMRGGRGKEEEKGGRGEERKGERGGRERGRGGRREEEEGERGGRERNGGQIGKDEEIGGKEVEERKGKRTRRQKESGREVDPGRSVLGFKTLGLGYLDALLYNGCLVISDF